jgi:UDP-N-acetyl-D-mannosaminuronic acid transferase (WecB/TagA/CpsF family)
LTGTYLCVGAAVDFAAGAVTRAPRLLQDAGLEWAYRLLQEPRRLWRRYLIEDVGIARYFASALRQRALGALRRRAEARSAMVDPRVPATVAP